MEEHQSRFYGSFSEFNMIGAFVSTFCEFTLWMKYILVRNWVTLWCCFPDNKTECQAKEDFHNYILCYVATDQC